jgi:hypothetical protein
MHLIGYLASSWSAVDHPQIYDPMDFQLHDSISRTWTCTSVVDSIHVQWTVSFCETHLTLIGDMHMPHMAGDTSYLKESCMHHATTNICIDMCSFCETHGLLGLLIACSGRSLAFPNRIKVTRMLPSSSDGSKLAMPAFERSMSSSSNSEDRSSSREDSSY